MNYPKFRIAPNFKGSAIFIFKIINENHNLILSIPGMEAVWRCEVEDFPAFIVVDNKGNDFFKEWQVE